MYKQYTERKRICEKRKMIEKREKTESRPKWIRDDLEFNICSQRNADNDNGQNEEGSTAHRLGRNSTMVHNI